MPLKYVIDALVEVPGPMRDHYTQAEDGKFHLVLDGHPDTGKVKEFRDNNIALTQKLAAFEGLDPVAAKAAIAKLAAGEGEDVVALKLALATEQGKTAAAIAEAAALARRHEVSAKFLSAGGQASAVDLILLKAPQDLATLDEWLKDAAVGEELGFAFKKSSGGGGTGSRPVLGSFSGVQELRNPDAATMGRHMNDIAAGRMKVVRD